MKNKKVLIIVAAVVLVLAAVLVVVLLGGKKDDGDTTTTTTTTTTTNPPAPVEVTYKLGMGVVFGELKNGEINATLATVVLDANGKIVSCRLDAVQNKFTVDFDEETVDFTRLQTKMELGTAYGMAGNPWSSDNDGDGRILEWDEQAKAFEAHVVGMTAAEVAAMTTVEAHDHQISADPDLIAAGCTIQIGDFRDAVVKACNDDQATTFTVAEGTVVTLGIAANSANDASVVSEDGATIKMNVDIAASAVVDGKIVAVYSVPDEAEKERRKFIKVMNRSGAWMPESNFKQILDAYNEAFDERLKTIDI